MLDLKQHLLDLSDATGISGYETPVRAYIEEMWQPYTEQFDADKLGSLIATKQGSQQSESRRRVLIAAHMDEIGLMVTDVDGAFLRFTKVGGIDRRTLLSQPVLVHADEPIPGLIGSRPPHVLPQKERTKYPDFEDLVIDTGLSADELAARVRIGTLVTFDQGAVALGGDLISGKAMDNRASVAILTAFLDMIQGRAHQWDVLVAATPQEEVGLKGGQTIAWYTEPDVAIVLDVTFGTGVGVSEADGHKLGEGPVLSIGPNFHPKLYALIKDAADSIELNIGTEPYTARGGTDAWPVQVSRDGVPTALMGVPLRNMHSPIEIVHLKDIQRAARLLVAFVTRLNDETLEKLALD